MTGDPLDADELQREAPQLCKRFRLVKKKRRELAREAGRGRDEQG